MELFKLFGTIAINNSEANEGIDNTTEKAEKSGSKIGKAFSNIGKTAVAVGKVVATGLAAGTGAAIKLGQVAIDAYSDYEQLVGGIETLFDESADIVMKYADNAYKTAGMSANQYMETVTSFSASLLQSLDGDTEKAAKKADQTITDMSDNANKMGTDMTLIQNAYQGFAKQNYTMLDNLKLGYGGTQEEMKRLLSDAEKLSGQKFDLSSYADIVDAIHIVQTEMGITGTTAKEASTTIQGSISSMKAAWQNLLVGMTDESQDFDKLLGNFVDSIVTVIENILPRVGIVAKKIPYLISALVGELPGIVKDVLPSVIEASITLVQGVVNALPGILSALVAVLPMLLEGLSKITGELVNAVPQIVQELVNFLSDGSNVQLVIDAALDLMLALPKAITLVLPILTDALPDIIDNIVVSLLDSMPLLLDASIELLMAIIDAIPVIITILVDEAPKIITGLIDVLVGVAPQLLSAVGEIFTALWDSIVAIFEPIGTWFYDNLIQPIVSFFQDLWNKMTEIWDGIKNIISTAFQLIANIISAAFQIITLPFRFIWENCKEYVFDAFNKIKEFISTTLGTIKEKINEILNRIKAIIIPIVDNIKSFISNAFDVIRDKIITPISNAKDKVADTFDKIKSAINDKVDSIKTSVSEKFNAVKDKILTPIEKARDKIKEIIDKIKGFFSGLQLNFPNIKLPHFSISPSGWKIDDLLEGSIPKLSIDWYAKAMDDGLIMNEPTVFGINSKGQAMAGGEAGSETVVGTQSLMSMIKTAVANENDKLLATLNQILAVLIAMKDEISQDIIDALESIGIKYDEREIARLVRKYA